MKMIFTAVTAMTLATSAFGACPAHDREAVISTVQTMFDAAEANDAAKLKGVLTPGFYAFDVGKRYEGAAFQDALLTANQPARHFAWRVTSPDVHIRCDTAWITYVNNGSVTEGGKVTPLRWLESAQLVYIDHSWRIEFLESARANDVK